MGAIALRVVHALAGEDALQPLGLPLQIVMAECGLHGVARLILTVNLGLADDRALAETVAILNRGADVRCALQTPGRATASGSRVWSALIGPQVAKWILGGLSGGGLGSGGLGSSALGCCSGSGLGLFLTPCLGRTLLCLGARPCGGLLGLDLGQLCPALCLDDCCSLGGARTPFGLLACRLLRLLECRHCHLLSHGRAGLLLFKTAALCCLNLLSDRW